MEPVMAEAAAESRPAPMKSPDPRLCRGRGRQGECDCEEHSREGAPPDTLFPSYLHVLSPFRNEALSASKEQYVSRAAMGTSLEGEDCRLGLIGGTPGRHAPGCSHVCSPGAPPFLPPDRA